MSSEGSHKRKRKEAVGEDYFKEGLAFNAGTSSSGGSTPRTKRRHKWIECKIWEKTDRTKQDLIDAIEQIVKLELRDVSPAEFNRDPKYVQRIKMELDDALADGKFSRRKHWQVIGGSAYSHCITAEHYVIFRLWRTVDVLIFYA